ncbi:slit and ntrk-like protein 4 [Plakobranchus ocellatus]|uniref:Slit and ntrk-like protein 4 n=1 Tax=Plakobranchus ocellatus TaxID=259542 RepID=A0AAV4B8M5_9GAST|nr:slit and ntrk-like protein 4 [Plakobranchus ocellatus]
MGLSGEWYVSCRLARGVCDCDCQTPLQNLELLILRENHIQTLPARAFAHLSNLMSLNLSYNEIKIIEQNAFAQLHKVKRIDLRGNLISRFRTVSRNSFFPRVPDDVGHAIENSVAIREGWALCSLPNLVELQLEDNPIHCDCDIAELLGCLASLTKVEGTCSSPEDFKNTEIAGFPECTSSLVGLMTQVQTSNVPFTVSSSNLPPYGASYEKEDYRHLFEEDGKAIPKSFSARHDPEEELEETENILEGKPTVFGETTSPSLTRIIWGSGINKEAEVIKVNKAYEITTTVVSEFFKDTHTGKENWTGAAVTEVNEAYEITTTDTDVPEKENWTEAEVTEVIQAHEISTTGVSEFFQDNSPVMKDRIEAEVTDVNQAHEINTTDITGFAQDNSPAMKNRTKAEVTEVNQTDEIYKSDIPEFAQEGSLVIENRTTLATASLGSAVGPEDCMFLSMAVSILAPELFTHQSQEPGATEHEVKDANDKNTAKINMSNPHFSEVRGSNQDPMPEAMMITESKAAKMVKANFYGTVAVDVMLAFFCHVFSQ